MWMAMLCAAAVTAQLVGGKATRDALFLSALNVTALPTMLIATSICSIVAVAAYGGKPRNPVLLAREHWPEVIATATGDQGARAFLRARPELVTLVECGDTGRPDDIDTPADLEHIAVSRPGSPRCG